jgi:citrate lyase subunit beta/citryl-CoA lyase
VGILIRRSNMIVSVLDRAAIEQCWCHDADAITLDLDKSVAVERKGEARGMVAAAISVAKRGGAEVFVRVSRPFLHADLDATVLPGLSGIVLAQVESSADVIEAADAVTALERSRGIVVGSLTFILMLESARAVWDVRAIVRASPRVSQVGIDETALAASLGFVPQPQAELDPFAYARGRVITEAIAAKLGPIGMSYPCSVTQREAPEDEIHAAATKAKNLGMKGVLCPHASWIAAVNAAFTPTPELVHFNKRVREVFAAGVAAGTAAVPLDGRMIDVPVDEWAIVVLAMADACAKRDEQKRAALAAAQAAPATAVPSSEGWQR